MGREGWDFEMMDRIERDRAAGRLASVIENGDIVGETAAEYAAWRAEWKELQAVARAAWERQACCGHRERLHRGDWCPVACGGCWATDQGRALAESAWHDDETNSDAIEVEGGAGAGGIVSAGADTQARH